VVASVLRVANSFGVPKLESRHRRQIRWRLFHADHGDAQGNGFQAIAACGGEAA
jgi:hypothetical protein